MKYFITISKNSKSIEDIVWLRATNDENFLFFQEEQFFKLEQIEIDYKMFHFIRKALDFEHLRTVKKATKCYRMSQNI